VVLRDLVTVVGDVAVIVVSRSASTAASAISDTEVAGARSFGSEAGSPSV
jgi:hypothetical protein